MPHLSPIMWTYLFVLMIMIMFKTHLSMTYSS
uniref:ATP synthase F0 subunit 8 n=1 Tax=Watersipora subtorquata TaxID=193294 RepID=C3RTJ0_9BILA|nr:ATP synthase F0 subunit 8 [Watersipora subtorquata]ACP28185.1 ATP synthase F0 subunit 8 [Watersipora subtorquata]